MTTAPSQKYFVQASRVVPSISLFWLFALFRSIILSIIQSRPPIDLGVTFTDVGFQTSIFSTNQSCYPLCTLTSQFSEPSWDQSGSELVSKLTFNMELAAVQTSTHVHWWHFDWFLLLRCSSIWQSSLLGQIGTVSSLYHSVHYPMNWKLKDWYSSTGWSAYWNTSTSESQISAT